MVGNSIVVFRRGNRPSRRPGLSSLFSVLAVAAVPLACVAQAATAAGADPAGSPQEASACAQQLANIQSCLTDAARTAVRDRDVAALSSVAAQLRSKVATDKGAALYYRSYWLAYADYLSVRVALANKRADQAKAAALEADSLLDKSTVKDQETYALQSLVVFLQYPLTSPTDIGRLIAKSSDLRAKLGNAATLRALYSRAESDFYTPKEYGGGKMAEQLLRQALALPEEPPHPLRPTWGRDDCAALLIQLLKSSGRTAEAQSLYTQWHKRMPDSVALGRLTGMQ
ncbi:hypothetical protein BH10PSE14_BH10PSE14_04090 [soil metagenome]